MPTVVDRYVRTGRIELELQLLVSRAKTPFVPPGRLRPPPSATGCGSSPRTCWLGSGAENAGWVTDAVLRGAAQYAGLDATRTLVSAESDAVTRALDAALAA